MADAITQHLEGLGKELSCSICLSVMGNPVARLPCCHYFCQPCITESIRHAAKCPVCKTKATRRDVAEDPTMDRVVKAFRALEQRKDDLTAAAAGVGVANATGAAQNDDHDAIPWLQGVNDEDFRSLSRSLSGTALDNLRVKRGRSKSPVTVQKPAAATAAAAVGGEVTKNNTKKGRAGSRKRSDASASQGIQKFFKKDAAGNKTPAPYTTTAADEDAEIAEERVAESPTMSESLLLGNNDAAAARQLDDIVAGLDSGGPTPSEQHGAPTTTNAPAAALFPGVTSGKENQKTRGKQQQKQKRGASAGVQKKTTAAAANLGASGSKKDIAATPATEGEAPESAGRRRIPTRLVPWNCTICTFENKGGEVKCQMCQTAKGAETPPLAQQTFPAAVAEVTAPGAVVAAGLTTTTGGKATAINRSSRKRAATTTAGDGTVTVPEKKQQQKKMTAVKQNGARGHTTNTTTQAAQKENTAPTTAVEIDADNVTVKAEGSSPSNWAGGPSSAKWVLLGSGLDSLGKEQLRSLGALCGATIADKWNPRVTHVICGVGGTNAAGPGEKTARRTFKYLMGVLHGRWVLTQEWVNATLSTKKKVDETTYQVEKDGVGCVCGAAASRAAAITGCTTQNGLGASHLLLRGFQLQLQGEFANKAQMLELVKAAGGKVVTRLPTSGPKNASKTNKKSSKNDKGTVELAVGGGVVLVEVPDTSEAVASGFKAAIVAQPWFTKAVETGVPVASHRWLTDSISTFRLSPLDQFLIGSS